MKNRALTISAVVLACAIVGALALFGSGAWKGQAAPSDAQGVAVPPEPSAAENQVPVVLTAARTMTFENRVTVSGSVHAKNYAMVSARIPGTLDEVFVDEGDRVEEDKTKLFQTDSLKLAKAVAIARQDLEVAKASVQEKIALLDRDRAAWEQAESDLSRYRKLLARDAVAAQLAEQQESRCKECRADVEHTKALIALAEAQQEQARLGLTIAEKNFADSLVVAPISGFVSERFREPGEMAGAGTPVLRIEDLSVLEIAVFLPEEFYAHVVPGKTKMRVRVESAEVDEREVSYKSPTVDHRLRTFEVKGLVESPPAGIVPGCLAEVTLVTDSAQGVGVPEHAIQTRGGRPVVFTVADGKAKMVPVKTGRTLDGWREILEGVAPGTPIVSMGQFLVEEGTAVSNVGENAR